jgi:hypothetical protein
MENNVKAGGVSFVIGLGLLCVSVFILPPSLLLSWYDNLWRIILILLSFVFFISSYILSRYLVDEDLYGVPEILNSFIVRLIGLTILLIGAGIVAIPVVMFMTTNPGIFILDPWALLVPLIPLIIGGMISLVGISALIAGVAGVERFFKILAERLD